MVHLLTDPCINIYKDFPQIGIHILFDCCHTDFCIFHDTAKIFVTHGNRSVHQVAKRIGKVGIEPFHHQIPCDNTVILKRHLMQYKITDRIHTEKADQIFCINHISFGFTHLAVALQQPWMPENLLRKRLSQCHQENRPVYRMETNDIFADQMQICRPQFPILPCTVSIRIITDTCNIIRQCIQPYIDNMLLIEIHRNTPFKRCSGYAQIL